MDIKKNARLRELLKKPGILVIPGCHDALGARLIQQTGFSACYMGGNGSMASLLGMPDIGLATASEMIGRAHLIAECIDLPLICDSDTGYGGLNNVWRTVRDYEAAGVSGIHIEDQVTPKKCGAMDGVELIPAEEMCKKIKTAVKARRDPNFVIIARTDSYLQVGLEEAIRRCRLFAEAGADLLMPTCVASAEDMRAFTQAIPDTPFFIDVNEFSQEMHNFSDRELETLGVKVVVHPMMSILHEAAALGALYRCYKECGSTDEYLKNGRFMPQREYQALIGYEFTNNIEKIISE
ncbi:MULTISPECIES: isocitrate lyase/PEP mutase family protein [Anaerotruncus]|uniref:isocitrate lyase/PEP mutase family protein n=1 Tax=Anaerotruncus TaxID=244127 RepID=UPI0018F3B6FF|nr:MULTISPECIES: isocitrate lyase/PEP mutase family protein [Anaerotruncus]